MKPKNWLLAFALSVFSIVNAQDSTGRFTTSGVLIGYGVNLFPYVYNPIFLMGDFSRQFGHQNRKSFLSLYVEPQLNVVYTGRPIDMEIGINLGIRFHQQLAQGFFIYEMMGSGPQYITGETIRQSKGFVFSDNWGVGSLFRLYKNLFANIQFEFRHMSNAGIRRPNSGDNNLNFLAGFSWIKKRAAR